MRATKRLTVSAMAVALGTVFMIIGAVFEIMDLTAAALSSLVVAVIYIEIGSPYTFLVWLCTSLATALMYPGSIMWIMYLVMFGIYPIVKGYIERLRRPLWLPLKLLFGNAAMALAFAGCWFILGISMTDEGLFGLPAEAVWALLIIVVNVMLVAYDAFISVMMRFYMQRLHPVLNKILK